MKLYSNNYTLKTISTHKTIFKNTNISNSNVPTIITKIKFKNIPEIRVASAASVRRPGASRAAGKARLACGIRAWGGRARGRRGGLAAAREERPGGGAGGAGGRRGWRAAAWAEGAVFNTRTLPPVETAVGSYRRIIRR